MHRRSFSLDFVSDSCHISVMQSYNIRFFSIVMTNRLIARVNTEETFTVSFNFSEVFETEHFVAR
jgi:hypothetical protein